MFVVALVDDSQCLFVLVQVYACQIAYWIKIIIYDVWWFTSMSCECVCIVDVDIIMVTIHVSNVARQKIAQIGETGTYMCKKHTAADNRSSSDTTPTSSQTNLLSMHYYNTCIKLTSCITLHAHLIYLSNCVSILSFSSLRLLALSPSLFVSLCLCCCCLGFIRHAWCNYNVLGVCPLRDSFSLLRLIYVFVFAHCAFFTVFPFFSTTPCNFF